MNLERRAQIADLIKQQRTVKNSELMERFGISIETVRRDLDYLEKQGVLRKVYGGAVVSMLLNSEPEYASRAEMKHLQKDRIAQEAAKLIQPGDAVYLGVGTTVQAMVQYLKNIGPITVFTNALRTAVELSDLSDCTVILTGGRLRAKELTLSEFPSEENIEHFNLDKAFIGIGGINEGGITDFHIGEARLHRRMIENARQSIALADSGKLGLRAMNKVCTLEEIDLVITDGDASMQAVADLENAGAKVIMAK
ncbi:MAG: DeoR/GlpR transcriptional regulator [Clostridia bacterium]|nr:DeoR/GlpR transcriptional regulator [Clostridia bacterium]